MSELIFEVNKKMKFFYQNSLVSLTGFIFIGLIIRITYTDFEIPLALDSLEYFVYAIDTSVLGHLPESYSPSNNGWSIFLAIIFSIFQFDNGLNYMQIQKMMSIIFSSITIIPIYFVIKQFFEKKYAILGASIFVFEPRIIINSVLGIADPLYIFLISVSFALVFNKKFALVSFGIVSLATMIRPEGLFAFAGIFIIYILKHKDNQKVIATSVLAIIIFISILSPMIMYKNSIYADDRIFGRVAETIEFHSKPIEETNGNSGTTFILKGLENFPKYLGWSMIPVFIILVPLGTIILFKEWRKNNFLIVIPIITMSIPLFYVYSIPLLETRYVYFLFPLFCVISIFLVKKIVERNKMQNIVMIVILSSIIIASMTFLEYNKINYESEKEGVKISEFVYSNAKVVNIFENNKFVKSAQVLTDWPTLPEKYFDGHLVSPIEKIRINDSTTTEEFLKNSQNIGVTHLVISSESKEKNLQDLFDRYQEFPILKKVYESEINGQKNIILELIQFENSNNN